LSSQKKLILDLTFGAVIPLAILSWGTDHLGARLTFILAGLIPALYVLWDVLFFTKKFNVITTVIGVTAVTQGGLSFLTVSGWKYALADSAGSIVTFLLFGGLLLANKPIVNYFIVQVLVTGDEPDEPDLVQRMLAQPVIHRTMMVATLIILAENVLRGTGNFFLNWYKVTSLFGTEEFNVQKRNVDAMTRFIAPAMSFGALLAAFYVANNSIEKWIGEAGDDGGTLAAQIRKKLGLPAPPKVAAKLDKSEPVKVAKAEPATTDKSEPAKGT
jgi:hypothetical protein